MDKPLQAAIFQYRCRDETPSARLARLDAALSAAPDGLDLAICPELFLSGYNVGDRVAELAEAADGAFAAAAADIARKRRTALIYGCPERAGDKLHNAAICIDANGKTVAIHRKLKLPNDFERSRFTAGDAYTLFSLGDWRIAMLVCYDVEFPEAVRACAAAGANLVVVPTALKREWAFVARALVPTRAFENGLFIAYANYCGQENGFDYLGESCFAGPAGKAVAAGDDETLLVTTLDFAEAEEARRILPYLKDRRGLHRP